MTRSSVFDGSSTRAARSCSRVEVSGMVGPVQEITAGPASVVEVGYVLMIARRSSLLLPKASHGAPEGWRPAGFGTGAWNDRLRGGAHAAPRQADPATAAARVEAGTHIRGLARAGGVQGGGAASAISSQTRTIPPI